MPTENKTANLGLNSWLGTDKPQRLDFVQDNTIIDNAIAEHINDTDVHLSEDDRSYLNKPFNVTTYVGNGSTTRDIELSFSPQIVFVIYRAKPFSEYDSTNKYTLCNSGVVAVDGGGGTYGLSLSGSTITVEQSTAASDGRFKNLNKNGAPYFIIAFK